MAEEFYFQVDLIRKIPGGETKQTAWIPAEFARYGQYVCINGEDGWLVANVYMRQPESYRIKKLNVYDRNAFACTR